MGPRTNAGLAIVILALPCSSAAQAWLPAKGEGSVSITLGDYAFDGHFDADGSRDPFGGTHSNSVWFEISYAFTDRFAVTAGLPYITTKLTGTFPEGVFLGPLDRDRKFHGDFQDFRFEAAFMALTGSFAVTPFVGTGIPSHDYETRGEAVPGKGIPEVFFGIAGGSTLRPLLPEGYVHLRYSYAILEKVLDDVDSLNRSNFDAELGYAVTPRLAVRAAAGWQVTHGGLDLADMRTHPQFFRDHDRAARTNFLNLGGGATFAVARSWDVFFIFYKTVSGENAHQARSFSLGATWRFGGRFGGGEPKLP